MITIGVVGGIASGKSQVAQCFEQLGGVRLDVDRMGHEVLLEPEVKAALREHWGAEVMTDAGEIDRRAVSRLVFGETPQAAEELKFLESISHPRIERKIREQVAVYRSRPGGDPQQPIPPAIILDAAVMVKAGWYRLCDHLVFVEAPREIRQQRTAERGWTAEQFASREASQLPIETKRRLADSIIDNSGTLQETFQQVQSLWNRLGLPAAQARSSQ